ncbi:unnamed protein product, partial [Medioppia subpectinata]
MIFIEKDTLGAGCFDDFSDEKKQRVLNEVKSLEKLDSIFVVKYYNSWTEGTHLYIHMEYCTQTLKHVLQVKQQGAGNGKYMAPEVSSSRDYDHRADIYSIGLIGAELFDVYA